MSIDNLLSIDDTDDESSYIVFAFSVKAGHLSRLAAKQNTTIFPASVGDAFDDAGDSFRREFSGGDVIKKKERPGPLHKDVVDAVIDQVASDGVVRSGSESDLEFGADTVRGCDQHGLTHLWKCAIKHSAKRPDFGKRAVVESRARQFFDLFGRAVS